ncbi:MAG: four-carbon acid sugar kinase family protein [Pyrinomonadaceae bacterium MAG19_C2-C3]|nr:four-carbon acid sugar kinase family protein [Pyrinomonadaceae bacterium MAG19_C2-C3]
MNRLTFAAVADDDTGASDLAGMLADQNLRTLLVIDLPTVEQFANWSDGYQAVVMAEGTRNLTPDAARERTQGAMRLLESKHPRTFQIKYCSTFDSTPEGNIGATIDAALDELNESFTIALPALPVHGRTTYQGYHFVNHQLLSESPMRHHPLTPMTNPNLVELLARQTKRRVGLASHAMVEAGANQLKQSFEDLRSEGINIAIVDCLHEGHLEIICRASADLRLITGSSAFGIKLPALWRERGWLNVERHNQDSSIIKTNDSGCLIIAGSCSEATRAQNEWLQSRGASVLNIHPRQLLNGDLNKTNLKAQIHGQLAAGRHFLLTTTATTAQVRAVQEWGLSNALTIPALGQSIANALADLVFEVIDDSSIGGLIVAGGETSGAVCRRLEMGALRVGRNIEPGVPLCFSLGRFQMPIVLKSGNFGKNDFYGKALKAITHAAAYMI